MSVFLIPLVRVESIAYNPTSRIEIPVVTFLYSTDQSLFLLFS